MRTLTLTITDGVMVVDGWGRNYPELSQRDDGLLGVMWDGTQGMFVYRDRTETFDDEAAVASWFRYWDEHPPQGGPDAPS
jgi:hypothetical protein